MAIEYNNKVYRNLEEQVAKNMEDIQKIEENDVQKVVLSNASSVLAASEGIIYTQSSQITYEDGTTAQPQTIIRLPIVFNDEDFVSELSTTSSLGPVVTYSKNPGTYTLIYDEVNADGGFIEIPYTIGKSYLCKFELSPQSISSNYQVVVHAVKKDGSTVVINYSAAIPNTTATRYTNKIYNDGQFIFSEGWIGNYNSIMVTSTPADFVNINDIKAIKFQLSVGADFYSATSLKIWEK